MPNFAELAAILETTEKNVVARASGLKLFPRCGRCLGSGHYSFNGTHSRCYGCNGSGQVMPKERDMDAVEDDARECKTDGRFAAYMLYLDARKATKNATTKVMDAWKGSGISAAYKWQNAAEYARTGNVEFKRDRDLSDINKKMCDAFDTVSKYHLNPKSETYQADVIAFAEVVAKALQAVADAKAEFDAYVAANPL